jgi:hypothetical protein
MPNRNRHQERPQKEYHQQNLAKLTNDYKEITNTVNHIFPVRAISSLTIEYKNW